jgi:predicted nucleotidyltransferase
MNNKIQELFFNEPSKHWHFEDILKNIKISRPQAAYWLKKLIKENIIKRIKPKGKMPYFIGNSQHPHYRTTKRLYAMKKMTESGFLDHLMSLPKAKTVIIFGSFVRWDWYTESDIDVFIYGDDESLETYKYQSKLGHDIQVFTAKEKTEFKKFAPGLLRNILEGYRVKGTLDFIKVSAHV